MPSIYYDRMLEELSGYLSPHTAREVLTDSFWSCGVPPDEAVAYDVRAIGLEVLPAKLRNYLNPSDHDEVLDRLEVVLMDMHRPPTIPPAKCGEATEPARARLPEPQSRRTAS